MKKTFLALCALCALSAQAQEDNGITLSGSIQSDMLVFPEDDAKIGTQYDSNKDFLTNTYAELHLQSKYVSAGARLEYMENPLPGFENDFAGWGVPHMYIKGSFKGAELTLGDFYDQFGSGLIFRTYEERALGIDNSLRGARLALRPFKGVNLKVLGGEQREYWHSRDFSNNNPVVTGADLEVSIDQYSKKMQEKNIYLTLGVSGVMKFEDQEDIMAIRDNAAYLLNLPENVGAFDVRANLQAGNYNFLAE